jgi:hypothetical protein
MPESLRAAGKILVHYITAKKSKGSADDEPGVERALSGRRADIELGSQQFGSTKKTWGSRK